MEPVMTSEATDARLTRERDFHNKVFADDGRHVVEKFYTVDRKSRQWYEQAVASARPGMTVLDYGCSSGRYARLAASKGARVIGIDISETAIEQAKHAAAQHGLHDIEYRVMNAEQLEFPANSFDLVFGVAILHHLDLTRSLQEIARVTKPSGSAFFLEPMGHNPVINLYRRMTPTLRTPDEHPLLVSDLRAAETLFGSVKSHFFTLNPLLALAVRNTPLFEPALSALEAVDRKLFRFVPPIRRHAWQVGLHLSKPRVQ
jgi:SAM-dependent methyltransferase